MKSFFRLSQAHLNLLEKCPPYFQKVYLEQLASPNTFEQQKKVEWGNLFHLLMQQLELGLPIESLLKENQELQLSIKGLITEISDIFYSEKVINREAEHHRILNYQDYLLTVIYDLLVTYKNKALILDWKTYPQPENPNKLIKNWQTKLYLYVLAETSNYQPQDISMTYWFVKLPNRPKSFTINYNEQLHQQTQQDLDNLLTKLDQYLSEYINNNIPFSHRSNCENNCSYHKYFESLKNVNQELINLADFTNIKNIKEIEINCKL